MNDEDRNLVWAVAAAALVAVVALLILASIANAEDLKLSWTIPCFRPKATCCDSLSDTLETNLKEQRIQMVCFRDDDTLDVGVIPELGMRCVQDSALFWVAPDSCYGTVGAVIFWPVGLSGKVGCHYSSYVFAFPVAHR